MKPEPTMPTFTGSLFACRFARALSTITIFWIKLILLHYRPVLKKSMITVLQRYYRRRLGPKNIECGVVIQQTCLCPRSVILRYQIMNGGVVGKRHENVRKPLGDVEHTTTFLFQFHADPLLE